MFLFLPLTGQRQEDSLSSTSNIVAAPATYVSEHAIAFGERGNLAVSVSGANPLPVTSTLTPSAVSPLSGTTDASLVAGPYKPEIGRPINLLLSGAWTGTVQVLRSIDGGVSMTPLTLGGSVWARFAGNISEPVWEETESAASFYLQIALSSGAVTYRVSQ